MKWEVWRL